MPPPPPSPALAPWRQSLAFLRDPFPLLRDSWQELGDLFSIRVLGMGEWVFACSPELIKAVFKAPTDQLAAGEVNGAQLGFMLGLDASFSLDGSAHLERRRLVHPLLNGRAVLPHIAAMRAAATEALDSWPPGQPQRFLEIAHRLSLAVLCQAMFGDSPAGTVADIRRRFELFADRGLRSPLLVMTPLHLDLGRWSPWGRILELRRRAIGAIEAEIRRRVAAGGAGSDGEASGAGEEAGDLVAALIRTPLRSGERLGVEAIRDEVVNLLFAGHETTGSILAWTLECILSRPEVEERVRAELASVVGEREIGPGDVGNLPYLEAVIQETIRYRPIAPMAGIRMVKEPFDLGGYTLRPGQRVTQCFPILCRRPELFARPEIFDPDHFFGRKTKPYEWNPFGGGTRMCIGRGLAEVELVVITATLLQQARLRLVDDEVRPERHGFFFGPSRGLPIVLEARLGRAG